MPARRQSEYYEDTEPKSNIMRPKLIISAVIAVLLLVGSIMFVRFKTIEGNQYGIKETWSGGVLNDVLQPKTYWLFPAFSQHIFPYDGSSQVFVMNNDHSDHNTGRKQDAYKVQSSEGQDMTISLNLRWRIDPAHLVEIHKTVRDKIEEKLIRPVVMRVVKDEATARKAIDAYSGEGLVELQASIQKRLADPDGELAHRGIIVENFVIESNELDPKYIDEIKQKQIATQRQLRAVEEQKAAEAEALVAKSKAQADLNKAVVEAQRDKEVLVLGAEAQNEQQILAAKAEKEKSILEAEGKKQAMIATAEGTLAMGKAEAEATRLKLSAYNAEGAQLKAMVDVSANMATAFGNIKGFLPQDMKFNVLSTDFMASLQEILHGTSSNKVDLLKKLAAQ